MTPTVARASRPEICPGKDDVLPLQCLPLPAVLHFRPLRRGAGRTSKNLSPLRCSHRRKLAFPPYPAYPHASDEFTAEVHPALKLVKVCHASTSRCLLHLLHIRRRSAQYRPRRQPGRQSAMAAEAASAGPRRPSGRRPKSYVAASGTHRTMAARQNSRDCLRCLGSTPLPERRSTDDRISAPHE